ncbi:MAG: DUF1599 domain-containing protein [Bacteroidales bacterium]
MNLTSQQYKEVIQECRALYAAKMEDYGSAWRILRLPSMTDQIYIKANRIRSIQMSQEQKVAEDVAGEFIAIVNYSIMALIQLELGLEKNLDLSLAQALKYFDKYAQAAQDLMTNKNHDYGEAWRSMRVSSLTDIILMKILRTKQIEDHAGQTKVSEGLDANYYDMLNYAVFALIRLKEKSNK